MRLVLLIQLLGLLSTARAQVINNWTNPASARWDSASWSLGILPASNQSVNITNAAYKAVNIDSATVSGFPGSLTVSNLFLAAPTNGQSTLLLNYTGLNTPLKVLNSCSIGSNSTLRNSFSSFEIDGIEGGTLDIYGGGSFIQEGGQTTASVPINILNGSIALTNGNMTLGMLSAGTYESTDSGTMIQSGGSLAADTLAVNRGAYNLYAGTLYAINGTTVANSSASTFHQAGGTNYGNVYLGDGATYTLDSGLCQGNVIGASGWSRFQQNGGLVNVQYLNITGPGDAITIDDPIGFYLRQGEVKCGTLNIGGNGLVQQDGGHLDLTNNFDLHGMFFIVGDHGPVIEHAYFILVNGTLSCPSMTVGPYSGMNQRGGSNEISGGLTVVGSTYYLPGGVLETSYTGVGAQASIEQFRGSHYVHGVLSLSGTYDLLGGPLHVNGLYLRGTLNIGDAYQPADFVNYGLTDLGGTLHAASFVVFGQVRLSTNALFDLSSGSAQVHCQNSSGVAWTPGEFLVVSNWHSSSPLASNAVYFGTDPSGLTSSQLAQVRFINPGGMAPGYYTARIMSDGEIVPAPRPPLQSVHTGSALVFTWPSNYQLLSATNINGPYIPVSGASSPWTNLFLKPQEFFRLQDF